jgi:hypothetical protein
MLQAYEEFYEGDPAEMAALVDEMEIPEEVDTSPEQLAKEYELYQRIQLYPVDGGIDEESFQRMADFLIDVGQITEDQVVTYEDAIDPTFVDQAMESE